MIFAQSRFTLPLRQEVFLTGNYAEIRPGHFHAGLDFKTDPKEHLPIYAVADGYVSRIKVGTHGYGKVLYVTHANGLVSVYGHQYAFAAEIRQYVREAQERMETFEIELIPKANELRVKQGQVIGYTGNTGDSGGPHLHFEMRDEKTEVPLNPLRFLQIADSVAPEITSVSFYGFDYDKPDTYVLKDSGKRIEVPSHFAVGVECFDTEQKGGNKNNVYRVALLLDGKKFYEHVLDSIPFDLAGYVNAYCHYMPLTNKSKRSIQKCFKGKNNDLPVYKLISDNGFVTLPDTMEHTLTVEVYDYFGRKSEVTYRVKGTKKVKPHDQKRPSPRNCLEAHSIAKTDYKVEIPAKAFYADLFLFDTLLNDVTKGQTLSHRKAVFEGAYGWYNNIPFHKACTLSLRAQQEWLRFGDKLCIVQGADRNYVGGTLKDGWVTAGIRKFGGYKIAVDTTAPKIRYNKPSAKKKAFRNGDVVSFSVSDDLSGTGTFKVRLNNKFQYAEYEHKSGMIFFEITDDTPRGKLKVSLEVNDRKRNLSSLAVDVTVQ